MNHNATSTNHETKPARTEQEFRAELTEGAIRESTGKVGIFTSADFLPQDKQKLVSTIAEQGGKSRDIRGGWGEYGSVDINGDTESRQRYRYKESTASLNEAKQNNEDAGETVDFFVDEDGDESSPTATMVYNFSSPGYVDGTNRPGNRLTVSANFSRETAEKLKQAMVENPNIARDIVKGVVLGQGVSEEHWNAKMKPRYGWDTQGQEQDRNKSLMVTGHADGSTSERTVVRFDRARPLTVPVEAASQTQEQEAAEVNPMEARMEKLKLEKMGERIKTLRAGGTNAQVLEGLVSENKVLEARLMKGGLPIEEFDELNTRYLANEDLIEAWGETATDPGETGSAKKASTQEATDAVYAVFGQNDQAPGPFEGMGRNELAEELNRLNSIFKKGGLPKKEFDRLTQRYYAVDDAYRAFGPDAK